MKNNLGAQKGALKGFAFIFVLLYRWLYCLSSPAFAPRKRKKSLLGDFFCVWNLVSARFSQP
ncbi:hypothetical protein D7S44_13135 [Pantoea piersonii]|nr:hypothetical protein D7S44_13135 [Pantoea piersonii]